MTRKSIIVLVLLVVFSVIACRPQTVHVSVNRYGLSASQSLACSQVNMTAKASPTGVVVEMSCQDVPVLPPPAGDVLRPLVTTTVDASLFPVPRTPYKPATGARIVYVATTGTATGDGSQTKPFAFLKAAVAAAEPGDVIQVAGGSYQLPSGEEFGLTISDPNVVLTAAPGAVVKLTPAPGQTRGIWLSGDNAVLDGFELSGFTSQGIQFGRLTSPQKNVQILRTKVTGGSDCIRSVFNSGTTPVVSGLLLYKVSISSPTIVGFNCGEGPCNNIRLEQVTVKGIGASSGNSGADAIALEHGANVAIVDVDVSGVSGDGIDTKVDNVLVMNAKAHDVARNGIKLWRGGDIVNSLVWNTGADAAVSFAAPGKYRVFSTVVANHSPGANSYSLVAAYGQTGVGSLEIANSIFYKNAGPIYAPPQFTVTAVNSVFFGSRNGVELAWGTKAYGSAASPVSSLAGGNVGSDPMFGPGVTFALLPGSPAVALGAGADLVAFAVLSP